MKASDYLKLKHFNDLTQQEKQVQGTYYYHVQHEYEHTCFLINLGQCPSIAKCGKIQDYYEDGKLQHFCDPIYIPLENDICLYQNQI